MQLEPSRPSLALAALCLITGCSSVATKNTASPELAPPGEETIFVATPEQDTRQPGRSPRGFTQPVLYQMLLAELAGHRGDIPLALDNYIALSRQIPDARVAERAAKIAVFAKRDAEALEAAQRWVALAPEDVEARHVKAAMLMRNGDVDGAVAEFLSVLRTEPEVAGERLRLIANFLSREEDREGALTLMQRLVDARPKDPDAHFAHALLALRAGEVETARAALERVVQLESVPDEAVVHTYVAVLQQLGRVAEAEAWLARVSQQHPEALEVRIAYARLLADLKKFPAARAEFEAVAKRAPDNGDVAFALGLLYMEDKQWRSAEQAFERLSRDPERRDEALLYLGQIAEERGQLDLALKHYANVSSAEGRLDAGLRSAILLAQKKKDLTAARAIIAGLNPATEEERNQVIRFEAELLAEMGELQEAMVVYDAGLADNRYDAELLYGRAMLAERIGRLDVLEADLRRIIARDPTHSQALNALGYTLADRTNRYAEAEGYIRKALALSPQDFYILDSMGWVLFRLGRYQEAVDFLRQAQALRDDPEVAAHLTEVLWTMGDQAAAKSVAKAALKTAPKDEKVLSTLKRLGIEP